jgi:PhnB protein
MTTIQPELWVDAGVSAVSFYEAAFGARRLHMVGDEEDVVAQLAIGEAVFWVATAGVSTERLVPREVGGSTGRVLLVVDDPVAMQVGRVVDPYGHEWEVGKPLAEWPPTASE